ncbi:hypothetical protein AALP_AA5G144700 [Arabis alpina]|uniref:Uncharacterized protein n=1 Tax=Arabis alpina TaxID=50452 RepID=A0A087GX34_ARAAL|nr:hypothetical protein AALP_AA5G144700 [Arabis alpina]
MLLILEAPSGITRRTICVDVVHSRKPQLLASFLPPSTRPPPSVRSLSRKAEAPVYSGCGVMTSPASISLRPEPPDLPSLESSPPPEPLDLLTLECSPPPEPPDTPNLSPSLSYVSPKLYETRSGFLSSFRRLVVTTSVSSPSFPSRSLLPWPTAQGLTIGLTKSPSPLLRSTVSLSFRLVMGLMFRIWNSAQLDQLELMPHSYSSFLQLKPTSIVDIIKVLAKLCVLSRLRLDL